MKAVRGDLLVERVEAKRYAAKTIVFARQEGVVMGNLDRDVQGIVDIPEKDRIVKQGEPIATGIGIGDSREEAVAEAMSNVKRIKAGVMYKKINC
jgi:predicted ATP-grasp superfamily ATP-dependent carboligase